MGGRSILVVSEQLRHHSCICTYNLVRMPPKKRQQDLVSWYSDDGGFCAFWRRESAGACCCVLCVSCIRQCAKPCCITVCHTVIEAKETAVMKATETTLCIHGSASSPCQETMVVARTRVIQPRQGMGEHPFGITSSGKLPVATSQSHRLSYSSERICIALQQAERYEAGYDVCSELASHDACVLLLIDHLLQV
jgi:hypothetical protein